MAAGSGCWERWQPCALRPVCQALWYSPDRVLQLGHKEMESAGQAWLLQLQALGSIWWHCHQAGGGTKDTCHLSEQGHVVSLLATGVCKALQKVVFECMQKN